MKILKDGIMVTLTKIINNCFYCGEFPSKFKNSKVSPIHKAGDSADVHNYRLISMVHDIITLKSIFTTQEINPRFDCFSTGEPSHKRLFFFSKAISLSSKVFIKQI